MKKTLSGVALLVLSVGAVSLSAQEKRRTERVEVKISTKVVDTTGKVSTATVTGILDYDWIAYKETGTACTRDLKKVTKINNAACTINNTASVCSCDQEVTLKCGTSSVYLPEFKKIVSNCQQTAKAIPVK